MSRRPMNWVLGIGRGTWAWRLRPKTPCFFVDDLNLPELIKAHIFQALGFACGDIRK